MPDANTMRLLALLGGLGIAVGALTSDGNGGSSGSVSIFSWIGNAWIQIGNDIITFFMTFNAIKLDSSLYAE